MSSTEDTSRSLVPVAPGASAASPTLDGAERWIPPSRDLPSFHHAEIATARRYANASRAASTQRAYASDWRRFSAWCLARGVDTLPADPRAIAVFLSAEAHADPVPLTADRRLASIGWMYQARAGADGHLGLATKLR